MIAPVGPDVPPDNLPSLGNFSEALGQFEPLFPAVVGGRLEVCRLGLGVEFTDQAATLNQRLTGLTEAVVQTKQMAEQQSLQQRDITALKSRLNAVEKECANQVANPASKTPAAAEEKW